MSILSIESFGDIIITTGPQPTIRLNIINMEDFPDIDIILVYECMATEKDIPYFFIGTVSTMIYDACPGSLYAVKKDYLKSIKKFNKNDTNMVKTNISINAKTYVKAIPDNPVKSLTIGFEILGFDNSSLVLHKASHTSSYYDHRRSMTTEKFKYEGDASNLRKNFWE